MTAEHHAICRLVGALRLTEARDGIGIPIYSARGSNDLFVGETDFELRITRFVPYPDAEAFKVDYGLLDTSQTKRFAIGDYTLIPFWLNDRANALPGDISIEEFDHIFGPHPGSVGGELRSIVHRSRTGYYDKIKAEGERDFILNEYPDIWDEEPVNSLYWVSRFRSAKRVAARLQGPAAEEMRSRLKARAQEWIARFQHKGHFRLLIELLRTSSDGLLGERELQFSLFESLISRLERGDITTLKKPDVKAAVAQYFPKGLFYFEIWEREEIQAEFLKKQSRDLRQSVYRPRVNINFQTFLKNYLYEDVWNNLDSLLAVTSTIYGDSELPSPILQPLYKRYWEKVNEIRYAIFKAYEDDFRQIEQAYRWREIARKLLAEIEKTNLMMRILEGKYRLSGAVPESIRPFEAHDIEGLRRYMDD